MKLGQWILGCALLVVSYSAIHPVFDSTTPEAFSERLIEAIQQKDPKLYRTLLQDDHDFEIMCDSLNVPQKYRKQQKELFLFDDQAYDEQFYALLKEVEVIEEWKLQTYTLLSDQKLVAIDNLTINIETNRGSKQLIVPRILKFGKHWKMPYSAPKVKSR